MAAPDWQSTLTAAVRARDVTALRHVPKTDLHCHALLSAPLETYAQLTGRPLPLPPRAFGGFAPFVQYITTNLLPVLAGNPANVRAVIRAAFDRLVADGVVYAEMSFDLLVPAFVGMSVAAFAELLGVETERVADRVHVAPEIGIARTLPADAVGPLLHEWIATGVCRSVDLYDDEAAGNIDDFVPLYRFAAEHGLKLKAHAGELCGPDRVRESVVKLNLHAVQHGVRAAENPAVADLLGERGTLLHICPTSNCALGVCDALEAHPAHRLFERGVRLTVNSDDFTLFGAGVSEELLNLQAMGFAPGEVVQIVANGLDEVPPPA